MRYGAVRSLEVALPGFELRSDRRLRILARTAFRSRIEPLLRAWASGRLPAGRPVGGGRGGAAAFDVTTDFSVVLRPCWRGGLIARFNRELHFGWSPRPFRELLVSERILRAGVPTVEVLAAAVAWVLPGIYRGAVVTREIPHSLNLWAYLRSAAPADRERACRMAAAATRRLHDAGAIHPDLNLQNYLVRGAAEEVLIIDLDRARLASVSARDRKAAFARLCRSVRRLDPQASVLTWQCLEALHTVETGGAA